MSTINDKGVKSRVINQPQVYKIKSHPQQSSGYYARRATYLPVPPSPRPPVSQSSLTTAADLKPEDVNWLIRDWIPAGKISMVFGDPGLGKSLFSIDIAARISTGRRSLLPEPSQYPAPNTSPSQHPTPSPLPRRAISEDEAGRDTQHLASNVLLFSMEDDASDTVRPRLEAAHANLARIHLYPDGGLQQLLDLRTILPLIVEHGVSLVVVDPLSAYIGARDISNGQQIRRLLTAISAIARYTGAAFLFVHHPNKSRGGAALMRSTGSLAIAAAARSICMIHKDPEDPAIRILAHVKGNLGAPPHALRFHIVHQPASRQPHIHWDAIAQDVTADTLLQRCQPRNALQLGAERFIRQTLAAGPMPSQELEERVIAQGYSRGTYVRAKLAITHSTRTGGIGAGGAWQTTLKP